METTLVLAHQRPRNMAPVRFFLATVWRKPPRFSGPLCEAFLGKRSWAWAGQGAGQGAGSRIGGRIARRSTDVDACLVRV